MSPTRELTPAEHARIRRQLVLIPAYVWLVYSARVLIENLPKVEPIRDFASFYTQALIARAHNLPALYDRDAQAAILRSVIPSSTMRFPPVYGPQVSIFFSPLAWLPYATALHVWLVVTLAAYAGCSYAVYRACPRLHDRRAMVFVLLTAAPALYFDLGFGQASAIGLVCVTAGFLALRSGRPFLAGLSIGSLAYKPPLGLAAAVVLVGAGEWWIVLGAAVAAISQIGVGVLYYGPNVLLPYFHALMRIPTVAAEMEPFAYQVHAWRGFFDLLALPAPIALAAWGVASAATLAAALVCWRRRGPLAIRYSVFLVATILVDPHMYVYDFVLLTPALLLLWDWTLGEPERPVADALPAWPVGVLRRRSFPASMKWLLYFCYFSPLFGAVADLVRIQFSVLALALLVSVLLATGFDPAVSTDGTGP
jgi:Glycosyltransferase family 87